MGAPDEAPLPTVRLPAPGLEGEEGPAAPQDGLAGVAQEIQLRGGRSSQTSAASLRESCEGREGFRHCLRETE